MNYGTPLSPFNFEAAQDKRTGAEIPRGMPVMVGKRLSFWRWWNKETKWSLSEWGLIRGDDITAIRLPTEYNGTRPYDALNAWTQERARAQVAGR